MYELLLRAADWWVGTAIGGGLVLLAGSLLMLSARQPATRQRLGEIAVLAALLVAGLRLLPSWLPVHWPATPTAEAAEASDQVWVWVKADDVAGQSPDSLATEAAPEAAPPPAWTWHDVTAPAVAAYLLVAAALASRWLLGQWALGRLLRQARPAAPRVRRLFTAMADGAVWPFPRLRLSRRLRAPVCFGLRRPAVLLPEPMDEAGDAELRWVFAHELTHLRRRDQWSSWGLGLAQAVYFYLPWFWWLRRQVRLCQEYVADAAAADTGDAADEYAEFLVSLARGPVTPLGATGLGSSSDLLRRVQMLLQSKTGVHGTWPRGRSLLAAGGLLAAAVFAGGVGLRAEAPADEKKSEEKKVIRVIGHVQGDDGPMILMGDGDETKDGKKAYRVTVRLNDDEEKDGKDEKKSEKKGEVRVQKKGVIVIDAGDGPVTIPFDGDLKDLDKLLPKLKEKIAAGKKDQKDRSEATAKALDMLRGELTDEQIAQLKKHIEELRAKKGKAEQDRAAAKKKYAEAIKLAEQALDAEGDAWKKHAEVIAKQAQAGAKDVAFEITTPHVFALTGTAGGRLGVQVKKPSADLADQLDLPKDQGLVIGEVGKGSPAAKAGLKTSDILLELAGKPVPSDPMAFAKWVRELKADEEVSAVVLRKGHKEKITGIKLPEAKKEGPLMQWKALPDGDESGKVEVHVVPKAVRPPRKDGDEKPGVQELEKRLLDAQLKLEEMSQNLGSKHPKMEEIRAEIRVLKEKLDQAKTGDKPEGEKRPVINFKWNLEKPEGSPGHEEKKEKRAERSVSIRVQDGTFHAEQREGDVRIVVDGVVDDGRVTVQDIRISEPGSNERYKRLADVPEKHRASVKRLISNTGESPVRFDYNRIDKNELKKP
jgi:beta-lactamase regulating signal transducer with metallopeptidase domain